LIYIDQPVGTGFSYGTPLLTEMDDAADEFVFLMKKIFAEFPQLA
jgi:carboxypeptidase C (cathepsin A)